MNFNEIAETIQLKDVNFKQIEDNILINGKIKTYWGENENFSYKWSKY